ncbi:carboxylating nicotinate-nucleotide diphosphorylase [Candidatus Peregrinibacteria bacterium]|nr:carboxylating nicotinate-nucleotide diphosphorylase [Candidatus Peregrinibacteria bacterium]
MVNINLANKTHNLGAQLTPKNPIYKQWIFRYTFLELEKDLGERGDITSQALIDLKAICKAEIIAKSNGILCGVNEIKYFLTQSPKEFKPRLNKINIEFLKKDGDIIHASDVIANLHGTARDILAVERVILNLLQRMSGVATITRKFVDVCHKISPNILITPTRKTLWGLLDKRAVFVAGGGTHRLGLDDAILIKDNHLALYGGNVLMAIRKAFEFASKNKTRFIEIETDRLKDAMTAALTIGKLKGSKTPFVIMLDNMKLVDVEAFVLGVTDRGLRKAFLIEASGGINLENIAEYAKTGVDIISVGAITHSAPIVDFSLQIN